MVTSGQVNSAAALDNPDTQYLEQHVFYVGVDGSLNRSWWDGHSWQTGVLPGTPASDPVALWNPAAGQGQYDVFFRDVNGNLGHTYWTVVDISGARRWSTETIHHVSPAGNIDAMITGVAVPEVRVFYVDAGGGLNQALNTQAARPGSPWPAESLPGETYLPNFAYAGLSALLDGSDERHVFYVRGGELAQTWWDGQAWHTQPLPGEPQGPPSAMRCDNGENLQHVMFATAGNTSSTWSLQQSWWDGSHWRNQPVPGVASSPNLLAAAFTRSANLIEEHVFYIAQNGALGQSWWDGQTWHEQSLPGSPERLLGVFAYYANRHPELHVFFRAVDGALTQTWWDGYQWQTQALPAPAVRA
jgi:Fungal fucose-specific lectin